VLADSDVERALVVVAHPDDVDFGAAGTIASWVQAGIEVSYCLCTNGDAGGFDPTVSRTDMARIRQEEQTAAAAVLGVKDLHFLGFPDGRLEVTIELRKAISRVIRQVRPQRVLTQNPGRNFHRIYASHPDHMAAGEAAHCAVYPDARNPFAHPELLSVEGLEEWAVPEMWVQGTTEPNHYIDVTGDPFELKKRALQQHVSQLPHVTDLDAMLRRWLAPQALAAGLPEGSLAEAFLVVDTA
jgi:LmbE family N-acetylglucosaminyl deacetylase